MTDEPRTWSEDDWQVVEEGPYALVLQRRDAPDDERITYAWLGTPRLQRVLEQWTPLSLARIRELRKHRLVERQP